MVLNWRFEGISPETDEMGINRVFYNIYRFLLDSNYFPRKIK